MIIYLKLLKKYEISLIEPLTNLSPIFLLFLSWYFIGETLTNIQILGVFIIILSTYFLEINLNYHNKDKPILHYFEKKSKKFNIKLILNVFLMLFSISITAITDKLILKHEEVTIFTNLYFTSLLIIIILIIYYLLTNNFTKVYKKLISNPQLLLSGILSFISTYCVLKAISIPGTLVSLIVPIKRTSTLFSSILGGIIFHEKHLLKKFILITIMLIGIFLINL